MTPATCADLLSAWPPAARRGHLGRRRADEPHNGWLPALLAATPAPTLPGLRVTICCRSAARPGPAEGTAARPAANFLRLSLAEPLPPALATRQLAVWLFVGIGKAWQHPVASAGRPTEWDAARLAGPGAHLDLALAAGGPPTGVRFALVATTPRLSGPLSAEVTWSASAFREVNGGYSVGLPEALGLTSLP